MGEPRIDATRELVLTWYNRAQIDYSDLYMRLYIAYNAWFRRVTRTEFDREAVRRLKKRFVIWDDYINGKTLVRLGLIVDEIVKNTHKRPLASNRWDGIVHDVADWQGLIDYWYQVRCDLFHGSTVPTKDFHEERVKLAYSSLNLFMDEITMRIEQCFTAEDYARLQEVEALMKVHDGQDVRFQDIQQILHQKFINSPDLWNVDMTRV
jgi:hypothetical protein